MGRYSLATDDDRAKYAPELVGSKHILVNDGEKYWVRKHKSGSVDQEKRDYLGYFLGKGVANVAEVRLLNQEELNQIVSLAPTEGPATTGNTFFIRLGGSYSLSELPCKTPEEAVATELVYSLWIRRRDAHASNRVYVEGIPIFFDFETAFLGQKELSDINSFFSENGIEGHANRWRVRETKEIITTIKSRQMAIDHHYVSNIDAFKHQVQLAVAKLRKLMSPGWEDIPEKAGFADSERDEIAAFLKRNLETLDEDIEMMQRIILQP